MPVRGETVAGSQHDIMGIKLYHLLPGDLSPTLWMRQLRKLLH